MCAPSAGRGEGGPRRHAGPRGSGRTAVMVGKAARLFDYLQDKEKEYVAEVAFGVATDTQDAQGVPIAHGDRWPDEAAIAAALPAFQRKNPADAAHVQRPEAGWAAAVRPGAKRPGGQRPRQRSHGVCAGPYGAYTRTWGAFARSLLQGILCAYPVPRFGRDAGLSRAYALSAAHTQRPFRAGYGLYAGDARRKGRTGNAGRVPASARNRPWAMAMAQVPPDLEKAVRKRRPRPMESLWPHRA